MNPRRTGGCSHPVPSVKPLDKHWVRGNSSALQEFRSLEPSESESSVQGCGFSAQEQESKKKNLISLL